MAFALLLVASIIVIGSGGIERLFSQTNVASLLCVGILILWLLYRIYWSRPNCPTCKSRLIRLGNYESDDFLPGADMKERANWNPSKYRLFKCTACEIQYTTPLPSTEN